MVHSRYEAAENIHDGFRRLWISYRASDADTGHCLYVGLLLVLAHEMAAYS